MLNVAVLRQLDSVPLLQHLQVLKQQVVIHGARMVIVGLDPLLHGQVALVFIVAIFRDDTDMRLTDLFAQFAVEGTGNQTFT